MAWKKMLIHAWLVVAAVGATEEQEGDDVHIGSPQVLQSPTDTKIAQGAKRMQSMTQTLAGALNMGTGSVASQNRGQHLQGDKSEGRHTTAATTEAHKASGEGQDHASAAPKHREKMGHHAAAVKAHRDMSQQNLDKREVEEAAKGPRADDLKKVAQRLASSTRSPKSAATDETMGHHAAAMKAYRDMSQRKLGEREARRTADGPSADDLKKVARSLASSTGSRKSAATDETMGHHAAAMKAYRDMSERKLDKREAKRAASGPNRDELKRVAQSLASATRSQRSAATDETMGHHAASVKAYRDMSERKLDKREAKGTANGPRADDLKKAAQSLAASTRSQRSAATDETMGHHAAAVKAYRDMSQKTLERREAKKTAEGPKVDDLKKVAQSLAASTRSQRTAATDEPPMRGKHGPSQAALKEADKEIHTQLAEKTADTPPAHEKQIQEALHDAATKSFGSGSGTGLKGEEH